MFSGSGKFCPNAIEGNKIIIAANKFFIISPKKLINLSVEYSTNLLHGKALFFSDLTILSGSSD
tara:strand:- start:2406 stop:2597 length:192 start_codon:yes stop_codon:yes gene_type:complete